MKPWKSWIARLTAARKHVLQWGHGDEAVEEETAQIGAAAGIQASMGPRR